MRRGMQTVRLDRTVISAYLWLALGAVGLALGAALSVMILRRRSA